MAITIKSLQPLSGIIGGKSIELDWPGGTLHDLIRFLIERGGPEMEEELKNKDGNLDYLVSINGKIEKALSTTINDSDEIFFYTPIGGG